LILANLVRYDHVNDPLGDSTKKLAEEYQAICDLEERDTKIRVAIQLANLNGTITINKENRSIFAWLCWRREVAKDAKAFAHNVHKRVKTNVDANAAQPKVYKDAEDKPSMCKLAVNVSYEQFLTLDENIESTLEKLDGQLSLKNATVQLEGIE